MNSKSGLSLKIEIYFDRSGGLSSATRFWEFSLDHSECMDHAISKLWLKPAGGDRTDRSLHPLSQIHLECCAKLLCRAHVLKFMVPGTFLDVQALQLLRESIPHRPRRAQLQAADHVSPRLAEGTYHDCTIAAAELGLQSVGRRRIGNCRPPPAFPRYRSRGAGKFRAPATASSPSLRDRPPSSQAI